MGNPLECSAILRVAAIFAVMLFAIRRKWALGNVFVGGAVLLGLAFGMKPAAMALSVFHAFTHAKTMSMAVIVSLILVFSISMEETGQMRRLLENFRGLVTRPRISLVVFPALIGLLPMPGGAVFSAPMVKTLGKRLGLSGAELSYVNVWFRHIWEYWWPLFPGVLLSSALGNIHLGLYMLCLMPLTAVAFAAGYWPIRIPRQTPPAGGNPSSAARGNLGLFLRDLAPILAIIVLGLGSGAVLAPLLAARSLPIGMELGLVCGLLFSIGWVWRANRVRRDQAGNILLRKQLFFMFYMVAGVLIFKGMIEDSRAVEAISRELLHGGIPLLPVTILLPLMVGAVVGLTIGCVGTTFPILISLIHAYGESQAVVAYLMLAYTVGFLAIMLSPMHLCILLSNDYFGASLGQVNRYILAPCGALLLFSLLYFLALRLFLLS